MWATISGPHADDDRVVTHLFACPHPGYQGWRWSVTVARASRAKVVTVDEVVLLPGEGSMLAPAWVPWAERIQPGDVTSGLLMPSADNDIRLEPGYTGGEDAADDDPAEQSLIRTVVAELGLGRERVLSLEGRDEAAERWLAGDGGPDNPMTQLGPGRLRDLRVLRTPAGPARRAVRGLRQRLLGRPRHPW